MNESLIDRALQDAKAAVRGKLSLIRTHAALANFDPGSPEGWWREDVEGRLVAALRALEADQ